MNVPNLEWKCPLHSYCIKIALIPNDYGGLQLPRECVDSLISVHPKTSVISEIKLNLISSFLDTYMFSDINCVRKLR